MPATSEIFAPGALTGRVVLVTGGGTNLGLQAAKELHGAGASVVIAGRREEVLREAAADIGPRCAVAAGDIRDPAQAAGIARGAIEAHGRLDVLVNNAGGQYLTPAEDIAPKGWRAVWNLNVEGTRTMTEAAVAAGLGAAGAGTVIHVTVSPHRGYPGLAHTGAARAAVEAMAREQAAAWAGRGISVVAAAIGRFDTESLRKYPELVWRAAARTVPLQRLGTMEEYAWLIALLASPLGAQLSGSTVTIDGALENWDGEWPRDWMTDESGELPAEERRPEA